MTPLAGPGRRRKSREPWYWLLAVVFGFGIHAAAVAVYLWNPVEPPSLEPPAATPFVVELAMHMASPTEQSQEAPPGPEQVETPPEPPPPPPPEPEVAEVPRPEVPKLDKPVPVPVPPEPEVVKRPDPEPEPVREPEPEPEPVEEVRETRVAETTAPPAVAAEERSEQVTAPRQGATSPQQSDAVQQWQSRLQAHLERHKRAPRGVRNRGAGGVSLVRFVMDREGRLLSLDLEEGSGVPLFDREALATLRRAEPLPAPPADMPGETIELALPVRFSIR